MDLFIEPIAVLTTLICVILLNMKRKEGWLFAIVASALYFYVFYRTDLGGQMVLQIMFILQAIYGWFVWKTDGVELEIQSLVPTILVKWIGYGTFILFIIILQILMRITDTVLITEVVIRFVDIYTVILALLATWLLNIRAYQSWLVWIFVDVILIGLFAYLGLWWSVGLYVLLAINAADAYFTWKHSYNTQNKIKDKHQRDIV